MTTKLRAVQEALPGATFTFNEEGSATARFLICDEECLYRPHTGEMWASNVHLFEDDAYDRYIAATGKEGILKIGKGCHDKEAIRAAFFALTGAIRAAKKLD